MASGFGFAITLFIWSVLYFIPGVLFTEILLSGKMDFPKRLLIGITASVVFYIYIGYILSKFSLITPSIATALVIILDLMSIVTYIVFCHRNNIDLRNRLGALGQREILIAAVILMVFILNLLTFLAWQNQAPGIGSWDLSDHLPRMLDISYHHHLPSHELGTKVTPYYPRGLHMAELFYVSPFFGRKPVVDLSSPFLAFMAITIGLQAIALYALSLACSNNRLAAVYASLFSIAFSLAATFTSYPCSLGMVIVATCLMILVEFIRGRLNSKWLLVFCVFSASVFLIHLVTFLVLFIFSLAVLAGALLSGKRMGFRRRSAWIVVLAIFISLVLPLAFLAITAPPLFRGTLNYMGAGNANEETRTSGVEPGSFFRNALKFRYIELFGFASYCLFLLPFVYLEVMKKLRSRQWMLLFVLLAALFLSTSYLVWFKWRVNFYLLIPLTLLGGYGLHKFFSYREKKTAPPSFTVVVLALIMVAMLGLVSTNASEGTYLQGMGFWSFDFRKRTYVTQDAFELSQWLKDEGLEELTFATNNDGSHYLLLSALTDARILVASGFTGVKSFTDMRKIFENETTGTERLCIIQEYGVEGIIIDNPRILQQISFYDLGFRVVHPVPGFWVLLERSKKGAARPGFLFPAIQLGDKTSCQGRTT